MHRRFLERGASDANSSHSVCWCCACELPGVSPKTEYVGHRSPCRGSQTMPPPHQARGAQEVLTSLGCFLAGATLSYARFAFSSLKVHSFLPFTSCHLLCLGSLLSVALEGRDLGFPSVLYPPLLPTINHCACRLPSQHPNSRFMNFLHSLNLHLCLDSRILLVTHPGAGREQELFTPRNTSVHGHTPTSPSSSSIPQAG